MTATHIIEEFIKNACYRMDESSRMIHTSLEKLDDKAIWKKPNSVSNSIGNLIVHLCGNITQYSIASLGGLPDNRDRDFEFSAAAFVPKKELLVKLDTTVNEAKRIITTRKPEDFLSVRKVQGFSLSGIGIIMHVVEHYSYHTGQIALLTKLWKETDLGFYDTMDLNTKNE